MSKLKCDNCGNDFTKSSSVTRDYSMNGFYDKDGNFDPTGSLNCVEMPDRCNKCGDDIYI